MAGWNYVLRTLMFPGMTKKSSNFPSPFLPIPSSPFLFFAKSIAICIQYQVQDIEQKLEAQNKNIEKLQEKERGLHTFVTSLGESNKFADVYLTKVFKKRIKRQKKKRERGWLVRMVGWLCYMAWLVGSQGSVHPRSWSVRVDACWLGWRIWRGRLGCSGRSIWVDASWRG